MRLCDRQGCLTYTKNVKYCSRRCASIVNNKMFPKRKRKIKFQICSCGSQFSLAEKRSKYCPDCLERFKQERDKFGNHTLEYFCVKNRMNHPSWKFAEVRGHARKINSHLRTRCQVCGYAKHVELAHIIALHKWPLTSTLNEVNAAANILVLCPNCHWEFDHDQLHLDEIPPRD